MPTWDLLTSLGVIYGSKLMMFLPCPDPDEFESQIEQARIQFDLPARTGEFVPVLGDPAARRQFDLRRTRDQMVMRSAEVLVPVSIRPGGQLEAMIEQEIARGRAVSREFETTYESRHERLAYRIEPGKINPDLAGLKDDYLIHWTRTFSGPWPDERLIDYYRAVISSEAYPRSAYHTLVNIITREIIRATSKHMPGNAPTVSFSGRSPSEMTRLMRWRARYREMSFEPYGLGIERTTALEMGVQPVVYYHRHDRAQKDALSSTPEWITQSRGMKTDWGSEDEYRSLGDFHLDGLDKSRLILICRTSSEADQLAGMTGIRVMAFER